MARNHYTATYIFKETSATPEKKFLDVSKSFQNIENITSDGECSKTNSTLRISRSDRYREEGSDFRERLPAPT